MNIAEGMARSGCTNAPCVKECASRELQWEGRRVAADDEAGGERAAEPAESSGELAGCCRILCCFALCYAVSSETP